ncbi:unnamed protein product [Linum trigynum]|uniref:Gnk2-homologous domain-containing protein n=1 Tax=Linum trigynum TaxID=586398 RepID=A0AAV2E233_9ROSI
MGYSTMEEVVTMVQLLLLHTVMFNNTMAGALNPMCGSDELVYCSPSGEFADGLTQQAVMGEIIMIPFCYNYSHGVDGYVYQYSDCVVKYKHDADKNDLYCYNCLAKLAREIQGQCHNKVGARYGTEECCMRYETYPFCES